MKYNIQFAFVGNRPTVVEISEGSMFSPNTQLFFMTFGGASFDGCSGVEIYISITTNGTKQFYLSPEAGASSSYEFMQKYQFEIADSGITSDNGHRVNGWVDLSAFGDSFRIFIYGIIYDPNYDPF